MRVLPAAIAAGSFTRLSRALVPSWRKAADARRNAEPSHRAAFRNQFSCRAQSLQLRDDLPPIAAVGMLQVGDALLHPFVNLPFDQFTCVFPGAQLTAKLGLCRVQ